ncbi:MAG: choice-of-anchor J domain-containing protein [Candidatus Cloacimonetes bacterium]|nr:choice-of-anchor J domain-containing protein [Candidatus Cloacimonadota bacterium]
MRRRGFVLACLGIAFGLNAEMIQIGDGALFNQGLPIEAFRSYSYSQQLYRAAEINTAGLISNLSFQYSIASPEFLDHSAAWKVYLGHTSRNHLDTWVPADSLDLVFDGTLTLADFYGALPGQGWLQIDLTNPFFYNGVDNLLLAVDENSDLGGSTADEFFCTPDAALRGIVFTSNDVDPDPADPPPPPVPGFFYARAAFPNLRLEIVPYSLTPWQPQPEDQASGVSVETLLSWQSNASSFDLWLGPDPESLQLVAQGITQTHFAPPQALQLLTTYHWQVLAYAEGETYPGPVWSFSTAGEGIGPPQNLSAYHITDHVQLAWEQPLEGEPVLYRVIRNGVFLAATQDLCYQDFEVAPGQVFYYYVLAQNQLGELSGPSNTASVHIPGLIPNLIVQQGFEGFQPFTQTVPGWQNLDQDGCDSWLWNGVSFPGLGEPLAWLVFAPQQTQPPLAGFGAHSGATMLASLASFPPPNNDWLISPRLQLGSAPSLNFWVRSHTADYGLERLRVLISNAGTATEDFVSLSPGNWLLVPAEWTEHTYDLAAWQGQSVHLAFNCVSWDAQALYLDDIVVTGEGGYVPVHEEVAPSLDFRVYPNPCRGDFRVEDPSKLPFDLAVYDLRGRKLYSAPALNGFSSSEHSLRLAAGIYFLRLERGPHSQIRRLAIIP